MAAYSMERAVPVLRMFDAEKTKEFYLSFLDFQLDWEHRYEPGMPLYMQVSNGELVLHLSEHFGDGTPGTVVRIGVRGTKALHEMLIGKSYKHARPGYETEGFDAVTLTDPSGNVLRFYELV